MIIDYINRIELAVASNELAKTNSKQNKADDH